jgi:hypothetical protein
MVKTTRYDDITRISDQVNTPKGLDQHIRVKLAVIIEIQIDTVVLSDLEEYSSHPLSACFMVCSDKDLMWKAWKF